MALTYGFFPSENGDRMYSAKQFGSIFDGLIHDGVYKNVGQHFLVSPYQNGGLKVTVGTGRAWLNHTWTLNDSQMTISLADPDPLMARYDAIIIRVDHRADQRKNTITKITGNASTKPQWPSNFTFTDTVREYPLAFVKVKAGATTIDIDDIENVVGRENVGGVPLVANVLGTLDFSGLYDHIEGEWHTFFTNADNNWGEELRQFQKDRRDFEAETAEEIRSFRNNANSEFQNFEDNAQQVLNQWGDDFSELQRYWRTKLSDLYDDWDGQLRNLFNTFEYNFTTLLQNSQSTFDSFMTRIDAAFDAFEEQKNEEINEMLSHLGDAFADFWDDFRDRMETYLNGQETIWTNWFTHIQGQLSQDAATNLQHQIDALTYIYVYDNELVFPNNAASRAGNELILTNPSISTQIPAFGVNTTSGHLDYTSNQTLNIDDTSGHAEWEIQE